jgi:hypothetical protein
LNDFLTSQERQSVILHLINSLRAEKGDMVAGKLNFLEGEAISKNAIFFNVLTKCIQNKILSGRFVKKQED